MNVVIAGAWNRDEREDQVVVNKLLDVLKEKYAGGLVVFTTGSDRGVGKIIKNRLMPKNQNEQSGEIDFVDLMMKIYLKDPSKADLIKIWRARNASLVEIGEEFHIFMDRDKRGNMADLLSRVTELGLPHSTYYPGVDTEPKLIKRSKG